jgi:flagellar M-ring protein FliF
MEQLREMIAALSLRQKISILAAALVVLGGLWWAERWNRERDLKPLFSGLAAEDAGAVVEKLRAQSVEYKVADGGGVILVPSSRVAELRLQMASAGLPKTGRIGFEIFDKANFGASDFAQQVNFRRALEGELERSVMSLTEVERARVHVSFAKDSLFTESRQPAKASVMVKLKPAVQLPPGAVLAIQHLAASAVEGLVPEAVSVLEMNGTLLSRPRPPSGVEEAAAVAALDYRQSLERELRTKIRQTLDPLLGSERYRADVSVDCDITSGEQSEESFDPARSVMTSSSKTEDSSGATSPGGVPGTASNLPRPMPRAETAGRSVARRTETIQYQTSRMVRRTRLPQGAVKRVSVAVLVDQSLRWQGTGLKAQRILEPPPPEKLKVIRDLVAGIVGFQQERGDQILVESLPFEATLQAPPPDAAPGSPAPGQRPGIPWPAWLAPWMEKIPLPALLGVLIALALAVVGLPVLLLAKRRSAAARQAPAIAAPAASAAALPPGRDPAEFEKRAMEKIAQAEAEQQRQEREMLATFKLPGATKKGDVLMKHIADEAKRDPVAVAHLVRTWLSEQER